VLIEARIAACAAMLVIAAIIDIKKREIPDKIWVGFGGLGALLTAIEFAYPSQSSPPPSLFGYLLGVGVITPIAYLVYKTGLFGGADSKALIVIAVLFPWFNDGVLYNLHGITALTVLTNALIVSMSQLAVNVARNLAAIARGKRIFEGIHEGVTRKALAFATGYRTRALSGYLFPMEMVNEQGERKFVFNPARYDAFVGGDTEQGANGAEQREPASPDIREQGIWVTQALPFIVYLAVGFALAATVGDLLGAIIERIAGPLL
jgi:preflagellin peptidase FlaK